MAGNFKQILFSWSWLLLLNLDIFLYKSQIGGTTERFLFWTQIISEILLMDKNIHFWTYSVIFYKLFL